MYELWVCLYNSGAMIVALDIAKRKMDPDIKTMRHAFGTDIKEHPPRDNSAAAAHLCIICPSPATKLIPSAKTTSEEPYKKLHHKCRQAFGSHLAERLLDGRVLSSCTGLSRPKARPDMCPKFLRSRGVPSLTKTG